MFVDLATALKETIIWAPKTSLPDNRERHVKALPWCSLQMVLCGQPARSAVGPKKTGIWLHCLRCALCCAVQPRVVDGSLPQHQAKRLWIAVLSLLKYVGRRAGGVIWTGPDLGIGFTQCPFCGLLET